MLTRTGLAATLLLVASVLDLAGQSPGAPDPFALFRPSILVTPADRTALNTGEPIARALPGDGSHLAIFAAVGVKADADVLAAWVREIAALKKSAYVPEIRRFSDPPRLEDLAGFQLDEAELESIRTCRPGDCQLKLSPVEMARLTGAARTGGPNWKAAVRDGFREVVLERVMAYRSGGHAALAAAADEARTPPGPAFARILERSPYLRLNAPAVWHYLETYPTGSSAELEPESFLYWSLERLGGRPIFSVTHVTIFRNIDGPVAPEVLVASKQVFATHYLDTSLSLVTLAESGLASPPAYLLYLNRSEVDFLGGFWGPLKRLIIERRLKREAGGVLKALRDRLQTGRPK